MTHPSRTAALAAALAATTALALPLGAEAQTRLTLKSASSDSSYYVMTVQLGEMLREASGGDIQPTVEESQGSVQNVREAGRRSNPFFFTTPPSLLEAAWAGEDPIGESGDYSEVYTLFPMPFVTIHFVTRADTEITSIEGLAGATFIPGGTGTFCYQRSTTILDILGLTEQVDMVQTELDSAPAALRNRQADGYVTCSSHPTPQLQELATTTDVNILSFTEEQQQQLMEEDPLSGAVTIDAGTYPGQEEPVQTLGVPVGGYGVNIDAETARFLVEQFWQRRDSLAEENPWWAGVKPGMVSQLAAPLHPGVVNYYQERGVEMPERMQQ